MLLAVMAVLAAGGPDAAAVPAAPPAAEAKAKAKSDVVCKTIQVTGSMFPKKVCYSEEQADAVRAEEQQRLRESQSGGLIRGN